jgi:putative nucleotidyltransferase with HDIG domain
MVKRLRAIASHAATPWLPLYYLLVVLGGIAVMGRSVPLLAAAPLGLCALWMALLLVTDAAPVNLPGGGYITASSAVDFAGILVIGAAPMAAVEFAGTLILHLAVHRRPPHKVLFNASAFALTVLAAGSVYRALGGTTGAVPVFPGCLIPLVGMGITYYVFNTTLVSLVIGLSEGRAPWRVWQVNYAGTGLHLVAALPFGAALAVVTYALGVWGVLLFVLPLLLARYSFKLYLETKQDLLEFAGVLAGVIDEFDPYTCLHSQRVSRYAAQLARELGAAEREIERAATSGLLHDIGKIAVSQRDIVQKPGPLTPEERARVCLHADLGADILGRVRAFRPLAPLVRYHHERMDGRGYHRLPGREVPTVARVVMVADAFDAMTTDRVYRRAMGLERALRELDRHAGTQFDRRVVAALHRLVERGEIRLEDEVPETVPEPIPRAGLVNAGIV